MVNPVELMVNSLRERSPQVVYKGPPPRVVVHSALRKDPRLTGTVAGFDVNVVQKAKHMILPSTYAVTLRYTDHLPPYDEIVLDDGTWTLSKAWEGGQYSERYGVVTQADAKAFAQRLQDDSERFRSVCPQLKDCRYTPIGRRTEGHHLFLIECVFTTGLRQIAMQSKSAGDMLDQVMLRQLAEKSGFIAHAPAFFRAYLPFAWLQQNVAFVEQPASPSDPRYDRDADTLYGAIVNRHASAKGIAAAYKTMAERLNVPCMTVEGSAGTGSSKDPHTWCIVELNGEHYHMDPSFGINGDLICIDGLLRTDRNMQSTHEWDTSAYPACSRRTPDFSDIERYVSEHEEQLTGARIPEKLYSPDYVDY